MQASGIGGLLDAVLSVDAVRVYKPRPEVYALVTKAIKHRCGARSCSSPRTAGTSWGQPRSAFARSGSIARGMPDEYSAHSPVRVVAGLAALPSLASLTRVPLTLPANRPRPIEKERTCAPPITNKMARPVTCSRWARWRRRSPDRAKSESSSPTSGVNPSDVKARSGATRKIAYPRVIPHSDGAGVIDTVGAGVSSEPHRRASVDLECAMAAALRHLRAIRRAAIGTGGAPARQDGFRTSARVWESQR